MSIFPPFAKDSDTSFEAAQSVRSLTGRMRTRVYHTIVQRNGATCDEIEVELDMPHQTASARVNELHNWSYIVDSRRRRKTRSGRNAVVWVARKQIFPEIEVWESIFGDPPCTT